MYRVMIADDERIERLALRKTLSKHMAEVCEIYEASNGREAVRIYEEHKIQIVILDIEMPGMNGIQAAEEIRQRDPECCIIFITAFDAFDYARKAIRVRAMEYLVKPYEEEEFLNVMEEAVRLTQKRTAGQKERPARREAAGEMLSEGMEENTVLSEEQEEEEGQGRLAAVSHRIADYICRHYMEDISMQDAARAMNYAEAYFCKLFKQCFSCNFTTYLTRLRMEEAKKLLACPTVNIKEIGEAVGYSDSNYFAKVFKRYLGVSPTEYRSKLSKNM